MAIQQVLDHGHCEICQKVIAMETRFCGPECEGRHEELQAEKKKAMWKFVALIAGLALVFALMRWGVI